MRVLTFLKAAANDQRQASVSDSEPLPVSSQGYTSTATIGRPENATAYTANDAIGIADSGTPANAGSAIHEFAGVGPAGKSIIITGADLRVDLSAVPAGMTSFRLWLYDSSPTAILDNAAWDFPSGDRGKLLGYVDLGSPADVGSTLFAQVTGANLQVKLASGSSSLYGILVTNGAFTPASATVYAVRLRAIAA